jgi:putative transposase
VLRRPLEPGQHKSWLFGHRLREAGLLGSMGKVACAYDNSLIESIFGSMQIELLDGRNWATRAHTLASAHATNHATPAPTKSS